MEHQIDCKINSNWALTTPNNRNYWSSLIESANKGKTEAYRHLAGRSGQWELLTQVSPRWVLGPSFSPQTLYTGWQATVTCIHKDFSLGLSLRAWGFILRLFFCSTFSLSPGQGASPSLNKGCVCILWGLDLERLGRLKQHMRNNLE